MSEECIIIKPLLYCCEIWNPAKPWRITPINRNDSDVPLLDWRIPSSKGKFAKEEGGNNRQNNLKTMMLVGLVALFMLMLFDRCLVLQRLEKWKSLSAQNSPGDFATPQIAILESRSMDLWISSGSSHLIHGKLHVTDIHTPFLRCRNFFFFFREYVILFSIACEARECHRPAPVRGRGAGGRGGNALISSGRFFIGKDLMAGKLSSGKRNSSIAVDSPRCGSGGQDSSWRSGALIKGASSSGKAFSGSLSLLLHQATPGTILISHSVSSRLHPWMRFLVDGLPTALGPIPGAFGGCSLLCNPEQIRLKSAVVCRAILFQPICRTRWDTKQGNGKNVMYISAQVVCGIAVVNTAKSVMTNAF